MYRRLFIRMHATNRGEDALESIFAANEFNPLLLHLLEFPHFPYSRMGTIKRLEPPCTAHRKTRVRVVADLSPAGISYRLPHLVSICDWNKHDDFVHAH